MTEAGGHPAAVLGVDGGNSKTDLALVDATGHVLASVRGPTASHQVLGVDGGMAVLGRLAREAARLADFPPTLPIARVAVCCLAGADFPSDLRLLRAGLDRIGVSASSVVLNDGFAGLRAGSSRGWGVAVIMGHGVNVAAIAPDGRSLIHAPGDPTSGDWGGGRAAGTRALSSAVRARDGRGPRTLLERTVPAHFGLSRPLDVTRAVYEGRIGEYRLDELAPLVFDAATAGDRVARAIVDWLANEAVLIAQSALRKLRLRRLEVDVILSGGVFRTNDAAFHERIRNGIVAFAPRARIQPLTAPPVLGAALLALDRLEIGDRAASEERLRRELTYERLAGSTAAA